MPVDRHRTKCEQMQIHTADRSHNACVNWSDAVIWAIIIKGAIWIGMGKGWLTPDALRCVAAAITTQHSADRCSVDSDILGWNVGV